MNGEMDRRMEGRKKGRKETRYFLKQALPTYPVPSPIHPPTTTMLSQALMFCCRVTPITPHSCTAPPKYWYEKREK